MSIISFFFIDILFWNTFRSPKVFDSTANGPSSRSSSSVLEFYFCIPNLLWIRAKGNFLFFLRFISRLFSRRWILYLFQWHVVTWSLDVIQPLFSILCSWTTKHMLIAKKGCSLVGVDWEIIGFTEENINWRYVCRLVICHRKNYLSKVKLKKLNTQRVLF